MEGTEMEGIRLKGLEGQRYERWVEERIVMGKGVGVGRCLGWWHRPFQQSKLLIPITPESGKR